MIDKNIYNKVIEICFPKISTLVKRVTYLALNGNNVNDLSKTFNVSKNTIYKNMHKYNDKYKLICEVNRLRVEAITDTHFKEFEEFMNNEEEAYNAITSTEYTMRQEDMNETDRVYSHICHKCGNTYCGDKDSMYCLDCSALLEEEDELYEKELQRKQQELYTKNRLPSDFASM